jgi:hypothetical protein
MLTWETRLTRFIAVLLVAAGAYGVIAGAHVTMYYDLVPNMGAREDTLGGPVGLLYLAAVLLSLAHLPLAAWDARHRRWRAAAVRVFAFIGPLVVALGAEGLISHFVWWSPISSTDRYHLLHHSLTTGLPLALAYGLTLRWTWRPAALSAPANVPVRAVLASVIACVMVILPVGILFGFPSLPTIAALEAVGAAALLGLWLTRGRAPRERVGA